MRKLITRQFRVRHTGSGRRRGARDSRVRPREPRHATARRSPTSDTQRAQRHARPGPVTSHVTRAAVRGSRRDRSVQRPTNVPGDRSDIIRSALRTKVLASCLARSQTHTHVKTSRYNVWAFSYLSPAAQITGTMTRWSVGTLEFAFWMFRVCRKTPVLGHYDRKT